MQTAIAKKHKVVSTFPQNKAGISKILSPYEVSKKGINMLASRNITPRLVSKRIKRMKKAGVPIEGLVWRLSLPNKGFEGFIKRFEQRCLEDNKASKCLNKLLPGWTKFNVLKQFRPTNILQKVEVCLANGIMPTPYLMANYSAESIAKGKAKAPESLNRPNVLRQAGPNPVVYENVRVIKARLFVVNELISKPHLSVKKSWLMRRFRGNKGLAGVRLIRILDQLRELGVISYRDGYVRISKYFRTGNKTWSDYKPTRF